MLAEAVLVSVCRQRHGTDGGSDILPPHSAAKKRSYAQHVSLLVYLELLASKTGAVITVVVRPVRLTAGIALRIAVQLQYLETTRACTYHPLIYSDLAPDRLLCLVVDLAMLLLRPDNMHKAVALRAQNRCRWVERRQELRQ